MVDTYSCKTEIKAHKNYTFIRKEGREASCFDV
jgi:hypothetical protein